MKFWQAVLWFLSAAATVALYFENAAPSSNAFLCLILLALILGPVAFLLTLALLFPSMRGLRLTIGAWLVGTVALLDASYAAGQQGAQRHFDSLRPALESQLDKNTDGPRFFFQGETQPDRRRYYVWCGAIQPPRFRVVILRAPGWYEVQE